MAFSLSLKLELLAVVEMGERGERLAFPLRLNILMGAAVSIFSAEYIFQVQKQGFLFLMHLSSVSAWNMFLIFKGNLTQFNQYI